MSACMRSGLQQARGKSRKEWSNNNQCGNQRIGARWGRGGGKDVRLGAWGGAGGGGGGGVILGLGWWVWLRGTREKGRAHRNVWEHAGGGAGHNFLDLQGSEYIQWDSLQGNEIQ